ncbi:MAG TPA: glutamate decarboxylase [Trebonia sp.]
MAALHRQEPEDAPGTELDINPVYFRENSDAIPRYRLPEHGILPRTALQVIRDELILDGNARLNLATFVTTWMEPEAEQLMAECAPKNMIDKDEYPQTAELEHRCVNILGHLWNAPREEAVGCSTTGSSEACMLGGMALLWRWRARRRTAGQDTARPNLVMGANVQVCWEKFCRYWDVEPRYVPLVPGRYHLGVPEAVALCDENTIGVVAIMGSTMDGSYEPVAGLAAALDTLAATAGAPDVPIHVDAASGGFVAPFLQPEIEWDFRLKRVSSINASGHKYGLVYPGVGWIVWRDQDHLPQDLIFNVNYLGGQMPTFALNFSRPGAQVAAQYYNFLRLGYTGYQQVQQTSRDIARYLSAEIAKLGPFELLTDGTDLPVFAFKLRDEVDQYSVFDISERLRMRGWQVPAYTFPQNLTDLAVMRIVIRNGFSMDLARLLLDDFRQHLRVLEHHPQTQMPPERQKQRQSFAH